MKKIIKEDNIYTPGQVTLILSFAEWQSIKGFASTIASSGQDGIEASKARYAASRLSSGSSTHLNLNLDWPRLFHEDP